MVFTEEQVVVWIRRAQALARNIKNGNELADAFSITLEKICMESWPGACHDTSAAMYVIFSELGFSPSLCIGEVTSIKTHFDHSWVELNGLIYDAAVCFPDTGIEFVSAPIFSSMDLSTLEKTNLVFGRHQSGLTEPATSISTQTLDEYSVYVQEEKGKSFADLWKTIAYISSAIGIHLDPDEIRDRYGAVRRILRN